MACVSTPEMRVLWNREMTEPFSPQRGVRQGGLISLYLFVLCMERLTRLITMSIENDEWCPILLSRNEPLI